MGAVRGLGLAGLAFVGAFALHIVGGATDQRWLFAIAVALIYLTAAAFPVAALLLAGRVGALERTIILTAGIVIGAVLVGAALWAANGRSLAWWTAPAALVITFATSSLARRALRRFTDRPAVNRAGIPRRA